MTIPRLTRRLPLPAAALTCLLALSACTAHRTDLQRPSPGTASGAVKIYVDGPGVHALPLADAEAVLGARIRPRQAQKLRLAVQDRCLPFWIETEGASGGSGKRLELLVPSEAFAEPYLPEGASLLVLRFGPSSAVPCEPWPAPLGPASADAPDPAASVHRRLRLEENQLRAPLTAREAKAGVGTTWYWAQLSQRSSSALRADLGGLGDRARGPDFEMEVTVRLLGWSETPVADGTPQHVAEVHLNGALIGTGAWDGRQAHEIRMGEIPEALLLPSGNQLEVKIPKRTLPGTESEALVDLAYVDWIEVRYRADRGLADVAAPLEVAGSARPRRVLDPDAPPGAVAYSSEGWRQTLGDDGGWELPPGEGPSELWIAEAADLPAPVALEPLTGGARDLPARDLPAGLDYVMIAPRSLTSETERLADFHRGRGLRVAVVDPVAVYDAFGFGQKSPEAIRAFLDQLRESSPKLRYVLLVGDADWLRAGDRSPYLDKEQARRDLVPTWTDLSTYGPAPSDHPYALDGADPASPRFAVGRLPVAEAAELRAVVDKILAHARTPAPAKPMPVLMISDQTNSSLKREERLLEAVAGFGLDLRIPTDSTSSAETAKDQVIEAWNQAPEVVYFGGHGSRFFWELGDLQLSGPEGRLEREDIPRLSPRTRLPVVISASCATAPFDHPSADSLGEAMVLTPERGAIAFIGAGVRLFTPRAFSEELLRALDEEATLGDALSAAKGRAGRPHVSHLYNLLGDPALPLR